MSVFVLQWWLSFATSARFQRARRDKQTPHLPESEMESFDEIKNALVDEEIHDTSSAVTPSRSSQITITGSDPILNLSNQISKVLSELSGLQTRMAAIEAKITSLVMSAPERTERSRITVPRKELFTMTPPPMYAGVDNDDYSRVSTRHTPSVASTDSRSTNQYEIPLTGTTGPAVGNVAVMKSNSATAPQGYVTKKSVWGTALASMLIGSARYYIARTKADMIMIDEARLMKNCVAIVSVLYFAAAHRELPDTKSPVTSYLATAISRIDKNDVPQSDEHTWHMMMQYQDGKDVLSILDRMIQVGKLVPEAFIHPISQIVRMATPPMIRERDGRPIFALSADERPALSPDTWETWCSALKDTAITKYITYRLSGMSSGEVVAKMAKEMKPAELSEKKNLSKVQSIAPFTMNYSNQP